MGTSPTDRRWLTLHLLCTGILMVVLDSTIVAVALPTILLDLHASGTSAIWMLNAYMLTFGGFLLLSGRLGDLYGRRRLFLGGISVFTLASLICGLAQTEVILLMGRAVQGLAGAAITSIGLSLITALFTEPGERARAMGIYGFICAAGGSVGALFGGFLTHILSWHWIFLVNVPIGIAVCGLCAKLLNPDATASTEKRLDVAGAVTITGALALSVYALSNAETSHTPVMTQSLLLLIVGLLALFLFIEKRVRAPLMPLQLFRLRNFSTAITLAALWAAASYAWFAIGALYLHSVLGLDPLQVGLAFVPSTVIGAAVSACASKRIVGWLGVRRSVALGLLLFASGLVLFARAPPGAPFAAYMLPGMLLIGLGDGVVSAPLLLAALDDVEGTDSGLASGVINTSWVMGGAIGLAAFISLADARTLQLRQSGAESIAALGEGYQLAIVVSALVTLTAAALGALLLRSAPVRK